LLEAGRRRWKAHPIEEVGARLRAMMPFLKARVLEEVG
jgi:ketol-acid reductoisomerase